MAFRVFYCVVLTRAPLRCERWDDAVAKAIVL
jgi:hypothetical protein